MTKAADSGPGHPLRQVWASGLDAVWQRAFGSPDLGAVDFATLERRKTPNDALACPEGFCPKAEPDFEPPVFPIPADRVRALVAEAALAEPGAALVDSSGPQDRYVVRTRLLRFPDTVVVRVISVDADRSSVALYGRSQVGRSDFGVNRRRLERWVERVEGLAGREAAARASEDPESGIPF